MLRGKRINLKKKKKYSNRAGEMAQQLRAMDGFPEDPDLISSTHIAAHNSVISVPEDLTPHIDIHAGKTPKCIK